MSIDHVIVNVGDLASSSAFYERALAPLELRRGEAPGMAGFGPLWLAERDRPSGPVHIALSAKDHAAVDAFHAAATAAGGVDHGAPGLRADYGPHYYAAFMLDPEGNNIEVVCHEVPSETMVSD